MPFRALAREKEENMMKVLFEQVTAEIIPEPMKEADPQNQAAQETLSRTRDLGGGGRGWQREWGDTEVSVAVQVRAASGWVRWRTDFNRTGYVGEGGERGEGEQVCGWWTGEEQGLERQ